MSELAKTNRRDFRWELLTTASALALITHVSSTAANAETTDRPTVWLELGGQLETVQGREDIYAAPFILRNLDMPVNAVSPTTAQHPPLHAFDGEGKLLFEPTDSDWVFSAAVRFGRSNGKKTLHQQTHTSFSAKSAKYSSPLGLHRIFHFTPSRANHSETKNSETHVIADFVAGRDVGLGLVGKGGSSILNFGVRMAQFTRHADVIFRSQPDNYFLAKAVGKSSFATNRHHHSYYAHAWSGRSFHGIGPSLSWEGSAPFAGHPDAAELTFDWGANAAVLFGRQRVQGGHMTTGHYFRGLATTHYTHTVPPIERSRSVVVPNVGGMAGISVKYPNAKFSLGYRADFFFNAMDQGLDTRDTKTQGFFGPYVNFAVGL